MINHKVLSVNKHSKVILQILVDILSVFAAYICSLLLRFGGFIPSDMLGVFLKTILPIAAIYVVVFYAFTLYNSLWVSAGIDELVWTVVASTLATLSSFIIMSIFAIPLPISIYIAAGLLVMMLAGFSRIGYRILRRVNRRISRSEYKRTMIIGAGETGTQVIQQLTESQSIMLQPMVIVDDDRRKHGERIRGVCVAGDRNNIAGLVEKYHIDVIIFCISSASAAQKREILQICFETQCEVKTVPGMKELFYPAKSAMIRDIQMSDLLPRPEVKLDMPGIREYISGSSILVTGGGGSIGSELCRQIAVFAPRELIVFDIYENNAFDLQQQMKYRFPDCRVTIEIGSVRDIKRLEQVFSKYHPDVVFHAAAHKHVPLMEANPEEAVKNNVFGTWNTAQMADKYCAKRFVLISTDKAVKPSNIMGATKRLAELVVSYMNSFSSTKFVAVRFGNVLGSNGSVIPLFQKQISHKGPVTVTHRDMTRFFMTIPEAAMLVLQAGSIAHEAEILILDMGQPVRIDEVARNMIRMSGNRPDIDIKIEYTGLRPGEKLHEELFLDEEKAERTKLSGIYVGHAMHPAPEETRENLEWLLTQLNTDADIQKCLMKILRTYKPLVDEGKEEPIYEIEPQPLVIEDQIEDRAEMYTDHMLQMREMTSGNVV